MLKKKSKGLYSVQIMLKQGMTKSEVTERAKAALQHRSVLPLESGGQAGWTVGLPWSVSTYLELEITTNLNSTF